MGIWRARWAAIGAAVAVSLGSGGLLIADATGGVSGSESSTVTVTPVRILDTRDPVNLGLAGPFVSAVSQKLQVTGVIATATGNQKVVPSGATAVLLNVTAVSPAASGFIAIRPGDATGAPTTSSLNVVAGVTVPNAVTVAVPQSGANAGKIEITYDAYGVAGPRTEILVDVVGYTTDGKLNALKEKIAVHQAEIEGLKEANATQDAYIETVLLGTAEVPSGHTVTGFGQFDHSIVADNEDVMVAVQLPGRASAALEAADVNFAVGATALDGNAACTGTAAAPTAPEGKVCIYLGTGANVDNLQGTDAGQSGFKDMFFLVQGLANGTQGDDLHIRFSWAYTAP